MMRQLGSIGTPPSRWAQCQQLLAGTSPETASSEAKAGPLVFCRSLRGLCSSTSANLFHMEPRQPGLLGGEGERCGGARRPSRHCPYPERRKTTVVPGGWERAGSKVRVRVMQEAERRPFPYLCGHPRLELPC